MVSAGLIRATERAKTGEYPGEFVVRREGLGFGDWVVELAGLELGTGGLWNTHAGALPAPGIPSSANARNVETCRSLSALGSNRPDPPPIVLGGITGAPF